MKNLSSKILQIIAAVFFLLYFQGFILPFFTGSVTFSNAENITVFLMFLLFTTGFIISWFNSKIGGLLFQIWYALIWLLAYTCWQDAGMVLFMGVPVMVVGLLLSLKNYKESINPVPSKRLIWKYALRQLLFNYSAIYVIIVIGEIFRSHLFNDLSMQNILYLVLLILYIAGFITSFKDYFTAGFIFIVWYIIVLFGTLADNNFMDSGPWFVVGLSVLLQGIFYIRQHIKYASKLR